MSFSPELERVVAREGTRQAVIKRLACALDQGRTGAVGRTTALAAQEVSFSISLWLFTMTMLYVYNWRIAQVRRRAEERRAAQQA